MNEQKAPNGIEWTRVYGRRGFTWNVAGGCLHDCQWQMPDGTVAECYAKTVAERLAQKAYPNGFRHHYWHPERLNEPLQLNEPAGIFVDSMSDLMGKWVTDEQIIQVLDVCRRAEQHVFFLLTKNAPRLKRFNFPDNVWTGVSSPPDWIHGKHLSRKQQIAMLHTTLKTLAEVRSAVKWISFEPLSWDCASIIDQYPHVLNWAVIGAASNGREQYPPDEAHFSALLNVLDGQGVPTFFKGNLRSLDTAMQDWREAFPAFSRVAARQIVSAHPLPTIFASTDPIFPFQRLRIIDVTCGGDA